MFFNNNSLVSMTDSIRNSESFSHSNPWVSPDSVVAFEGSLTSSIFLSELVSNIKRAIWSTVDFCAIRDSDTASFLNCFSLWVFTVSVGNVQSLDNSYPRVSKNWVLSMNSLDAWVIKLSDFLCHIMRAIGCTKDLNESMISLFGMRSLELDGVNRTNQIGDGSCDKKLHIFEIYLNWIIGHIINISLDSYG